MTADELKRLAAAAAVAEVRDGMIVGLGSGSTAQIGIDLLAERVAQGLKVRCVATSDAGAGRARRLGLDLLDPNDVASIDLTFDGADEIDPELHLIKGRGGALLREKLVAGTSQIEIIIADASKLVAELGARVPLPVEVVRFGCRLTDAGLRKLGADPMLRLRDGAPLITDGGNLILDCTFSSRKIDEELGIEIKGTSGVVEHGLFWELASFALVADEDGRVSRMDRPA